MSSCWVCANPAENHWPSNDPDPVGVCGAFSAFVCNKHGEIDTLTGVLVCSPCVGGDASTPPRNDPGPGPGDRPGGGRPRGPGGMGLKFSDLADLIRRFPRFSRAGRAHADAFRERVDAEMIGRIAAAWEEQRGQVIDRAAFDEELVAAGVFHPSDLVEENAPGSCATGLHHCGRIRGCRHPRLVSAVPHRCCLRALDAWGRGCCRPADRGDERGFGL